MPPRLLNPHAPENRVAGVLRRDSNASSHPSWCECKTCEELNTRAATLVEAYEDGFDPEIDGYADDYDDDY